MRLANYSASLRLEGFELKSEVSDVIGQDKQSLVAHYRRLSQAQ